MQWKRSIMQKLTWNLGAGGEKIRGIQVDIPDLKKSSIDSVSVDTSIEGDFSKAVYNSQGDYIRVIAAAYEGFLKMIMPLSLFNIIIKGKKLFYLRKYIFRRRRDCCKGY